MRHSKSSLFLMELIIAILFFSLASTVCIRLFAKSHMLSIQTVDQNQAVTQSQNLAECYLAFSGNLAEIAPLFPEAEYRSEDSQLLLYFDADWNPCKVDEAYLYIASLKHSPVDQEGLIHGEIQVIKVESTGQENMIYSLNVAHHIPERRGTHES